jgi:type I restriction enzyme S subunit
MLDGWKELCFEAAPIEILDGDRGSNYPNGSDFSAVGHCLFLNAGNVTVSGFEFSNCSFITKEKDTLLRKGKLKRLDSVLTTRGTVGNTAFYDFSIPYDNVRINSGMVIFRPDPQQIDAKYLYKFLKSNIFKSQVQSLTSGSAQPQLPIKDIKRISIPLPPLPEQRAIAEVLGVLDDKIDLNRRMNETLEATARALFKSWFVDFDPVRAKAEGRPPEGLTPDLAALFPSSFTPSPLGDIPDGWRVEKIETLIKRLPVGKKYEQKTVSPVGNIPVLDQGKSGIIGFHNDSPGIQASVKEPVIVFANHTCFMRLVSFDFSAIQNVLPFVGQEHKTIWLYYATRGKQAFSEYKGHWPDFVLHEIVNPSIQLTSEFEKIIRPFVEKIIYNDQQSQTLAQTRDALLPKLMSGQLRVQDAQSLVEGLE